MKFSYNWLQSYFSKPLPKPKELAEVLTMHSFEVEEVSKKGGDWMLDIDILPNRAHDCLSYFGLAREIGALLKNERGQSFHCSAPPRTIRCRTPLRKLRAVPGSRKHELLTVNIEKQDLIPRYAAYVVEGVKITESPKWIKDRLGSIEQKAINNVVDITNYIMWDIGQPLHAFDFKKIGGGRMTIRESKKGEKIETLDGEVHNLGNSDIIIEDSERIIDLAGIKGGSNTQIDAKSKTIILQAAIFDPARVRKTTQSLGFRTDAATRYIHGFDPNVSLGALNKALSLLLETSPNAKVVQVIDIYPEKTKPNKIMLDVNYVNRLLGAYLSVREIKQILDRLGFEVKGGKLKITNYKLLITAPSYRLDIENQEDVIEEIGRVFGYENIRAVSPQGILVKPRRNGKVFWRSIARGVLSGFGFSEVYNYSLIGKPSFVRDYGRARPPVKDEDFIELENPVSDEFRYARPMLLFGALKNMSDNARHFDSLKIFEFGKVFYKEKNKIKEDEDLGIALNDPDGFYLAKGYVDELMGALGLTDFYYDPMQEGDEHASFLHAGRRTNIMLDGKLLGFLGEVEPSLVSSYGVKGRVVAAELDFERIIEEAEEEHEYHKPSKYPEVVRDISILVPQDVRVADVLNEINSVSGPLLRDVDLFDMFSAESDSAGTRKSSSIRFDGAAQADVKSLAFHLIFQSDERTLTSEEVDRAMDKILKVLKDNLWEVR